MLTLDVQSVSVCIQALDDAIRHCNLLAQLEAVNSDDFEEFKYMYEVELSRLCKVYSQVEARGEAPIPLKKLLNQIQQT